MTWTRSTSLFLLVALVVLIPRVSVANSGDFSGGVAIGSSYAGVDSAPSNGLIVQGSVSIGTSSSNTALTLSQNSSGTPTILRATDAIQVVLPNSTAGGIEFDTFAGYTIIDCVRSDGTLSSPSAVQSGDILCAVPQAHGYNGSTLSGTQSAMLMIAGGNWSTTSEPAYITFGTTPVGSITRAEAMRIDSTGFVGIGTTSPAHLLHVGSSTASGIVMELQNSSGACTYNPGASSVTVSCSSDVRLKSNVHDAGDALSWVDDMRVRDFTVKSTGEQRRGVVAQEVSLKHPEMVHQDEHGGYLVEEPNPWNLVKAIQEQQAEIAELKKTIEQMKQH